MNRREFLRQTAAAVAAPAFIQSAGGRPQLPCGVATGDVTTGGAIVWSKCDRPARLIVEYATRPLASAASSLRRTTRNGSAVRNSSISKS